MTPNASFQHGALHRSLRTASTFRSQVITKRSKRPNSVPAWLLLSGIVLIPSSLAVRLAGDAFKFTPGRAAITLLFIPAVLKFLQGNRHFVPSDLFVFLTAAWMIGSRISDDGIHASAVAEVIELFGGYVVARAFFLAATLFRISCGSSKYCSL